MLVGLHDAERDSMPKKVFPNYALMKISAYHKARGNTVEWWQPFNNPVYGAVYSSKVFTFTRENPYLPPGTIKGGTGYDVKSKLPPEIEECVPDYSIYPEFDATIGFVTRGCPNHCPWCVVPKKEGGVAPYLSLEEILASRNHRSNNIVLLDNNILASGFGVTQLLKLGSLPYRVDMNQGLDARRVTPEIADLLAKINRIKYIRFACDASAAVAPLASAVRLLNERGIPPSSIFVYFLVRDIPDAMARVRELRHLGAITLYAQAYRALSNGGKPISKESVYFAQKYIYSGQWRKQDWYDTPWGQTFSDRNR